MTDAARLAVIRAVAARVASWAGPALKVSPSAVGLLLLGIALAMLQPILPLTGVLASLMLLAIIVGWRWTAWRLLAIPMLGYAWASLHGGWALQQRLPVDLVGQELVIEGRVIGLPQQQERRTAFDFRVVSGDAEAAVLAGRRLRLAWYDASPDLLQADQRWRLRVRLKRPRGLLNAGGFDFERYALQRQLAATGSVRAGPDNRMLVEQPGIDWLRNTVAKQITHVVGASSARLLNGLAVGDTRGLLGADWEVLQATGLSHLLAISGLHIGLLAGFGALFGRLGYWLWPSLGLHLPRPQGTAVLALVFALGYAALAGFGLPAQRSLLMIGVVVLARVSRRTVRPLQGLALAALSILLVDPLALLGAGFWLSFVGVAWLLLCLHGDSGRLAAVRNLLRAQWAMSLGLLPLTLWFFGQVSIVGAGINLLAVPWVSLLVVPLTLLGTALLFCWPWAAAGVLGLAAHAMDALWWGASRVADHPWAQWYTPEASLLAFVSAAIGVFWLLLPRPVPGKALALLLLLPMLFPVQPRLAEGDLQIQLVDVGQGLSVLLRTRDHTMLYDAGPAFVGGLDLGEAAVLPSLRAAGIDQLDLLLLSHGDNDHAGGAAAIRRAFPGVQVIAGEPSREPGAEPCERGRHWLWSGVSFEILHPTADFPELRNASSCVLRVVAAGGTVLLAGDIDTVIEARLLRTVPEQLQARLLLVPHHGSAGSSSAAFIAAVAPEYALISAGHDNRFGHPRPEVVERYTAHGSALLQTAQAGAISIVIEHDGDLRWEARRDSHRRFWHEQ